MMGYYVLFTGNIWISASDYDYYYVYIKFIIVIPLVLQ